MVDAEDLNNEDLAVVCRIVGEHEGQCGKEMWFVCTGCEKQMESDITCGRCKRCGQWERGLRYDMDEGHEHGIRNMFRCSTCVYWLR